MKITNIMMLFVLICFFPQLPAGAERLPASSGILTVSQERALEQRADQIIEINDALIQKTIQANGGNYFHQGKSKILIFNQKIYTDFTIRVVSGNRLVIETQDGTFQMDVLNP
ncbi:MAG: hypothetical protein AB1427_06145 [Thermodesulfobacteriota bacterium]